MDVRFDSFAVPAVSRSVRAVLFSAQQAAQLHSPAIVDGQPAVLFSVSDQQDRAIKNGIGIVAPGMQRLIGGLLLGANVQGYPAIVVASAPYFPVVILGLLLIIAGAIMSRSR
jgi:hypothetical protein